MTQRPPHAASAPAPGIPSTLRTDWLTDELAGHGGVFVSGSRVSSQRICGEDFGGLLTLRVIGHFPHEMAQRVDRTQQRGWLPSHYQLMMAFVAVELPTQDEVDAFNPGRKLLEFRQYVEKLLNSGGAARVWVSLIAFHQARGTLFGRLWVRDEALGFAGGLEDAWAYAQAINGARAPLAGDDPARVKPINRSLNDSFQNWTRSYLTGQLAINDIDALVRLPVSGSGSRTVAVLELKRSGLAGWRPYLDDVPNYMLYKAVARQAGHAIDLTVRYAYRNPARDSRAAEIHVLSSVSHDRILGFSKTVSGHDASSTVAALLTELSRMIDRAYTSTTRR